MDSGIKLGSRHFLEGRLDRIGEFFTREFIDTGKIAGCQVVVARGGEVGLFDQWGVANIERAEPLRRESIWRIMSMTKPVTVTCLMMLFEEGGFRLDDPLSKHLPGWREQRVWVSGRGKDMVTEPLKRDVTVRDMLRHTSGLTYGHALYPVAEGEIVHPVDEVYMESGVTLARDGSMEEFIDRISQVPLRYQPGEGWMYSMSSDVVGALVEAISGEKLSAFMRARIFEPLGMDDTAFWVPEEKRDRFTTCYSRGPDGGLVVYDSPDDSVYNTDPAFCAGGMGLVSTSPDFLRFAEMIRRGGELDGVRLLSPRSTRLMLTNNLPGGLDIATISAGLFEERGNDGVGYGLGFATTFDPVRAGSIADNDCYWGGLHSSLFWIDPVAELSVIFMVQFMPARVHDFRGPMRSLVYSSLT